MAKFKDLKLGDLFIFVAEPKKHIYEARGNNWYDLAEGGAGGPWHRYDNPEVKVVAAHRKHLRRG